MVGHMRGEVLSDERAHLGSKMAAYGDRIYCIYHELGDKN